MRVSDQDRHAVAEVLRQAAGEGRIDLEELDERLEATYAAKTYADLVPLTSDLPAVRQPEGEGAVAPRRVWQPPVPMPAYTSSIAVMSETKRSGLWEVRAEHQAFALMGSVVLDLRYARFTSQHVTITANALMGGVEVIVNPFTHYVVDGVGIMGTFGDTKARVQAHLSPDSPVVRVRGIAIMGAVEIKRKQARS
jgi:hypothetical protein